MVKAEVYVDEEDKYFKLMKGICGEIQKYCNDSIIFYQFGLSHTYHNGPELTPTCDIKIKRDPPSGECPAG